jgi:glycosyltransferase involved in cell wall biosynthesis
MRLAWFSPMPPVRSGIATCSADLVHALRREHDVDVYVDAGAKPAAIEGTSAHEFIWRHQQHPYDLTIFQLGNSSHHDFIWPYLFRFPGLAVLHDARLHHARAALLLRERKIDDYRAEFAANEAEVSADAAELAVAGFDSHLLYAWPFTRLIVSASRMTAVHSRLMRDALGERHPGASIEYLRLGHGTEVAADAIAARRDAGRRAHGLPADAIVFACIGGLTPEKRIPQILEAFAALLPYDDRARLLLAGSPAAHYDVAADVRRRGLGNRVVMTGYLSSDDALTDCIAAADVTLNLRWPTAREMSGPWLRSLAAGRASIIIDLEHLADVPALDPRTWAVTQPGATPICVAIDILDEDHSLRLAMRRLARDAALRDSLGEAARAYWTRKHSAAAMLDDYRRLLPIAAQMPAPRPSLPRHLIDNGNAFMTSILDEIGVAVPWS